MIIILLYEKVVLFLAVFPGSGKGAPIPFYYDIFTRVDMRVFSTNFTAAIVATACSSSPGVIDYQIKKFRRQVLECFRLDGEGPEGGSSFPQSELTTSNNCKPPNYPIKITDRNNSGVTLFMDYTNKGRAIYLNVNNTNNTRIFHECLVEYVLPTLNTNYFNSLPMQWEWIVAFDICLLLCLIVSFRTGFKDSPEEMFIGWFIPYLGISLLIKDLLNFAFRYFSYVPIGYPLPDVNIITGFEVWNLPVGDFNIPEYKVLSFFFLPADIIIIPGIISLFICCTPVGCIFMPVDPDRVNFNSVFLISAVSQLFAVMRFIGVDQ